MKKNFFSTKIVIIYLFLISVCVSKESAYLIEAIKHYEKNDFIKSKILFEKDLVFNPKSEKSYLYLAKIFQKEDIIDEQEINLNNVLLLNPQNDEALYMLTLIKIKQSNYQQAKELIAKFTLVCKTFCSKKDEMNEKFIKISPENEKSNN